MTVRTLFRMADTMPGEVAPDICFPWCREARWLGLSVFDDSPTVLSSAEPPLRGDVLSRSDS
jgi:hypothetical protein